MNALFVEESSIGVRGRDVQGLFCCDRCWKEPSSQGWKGVHAYSEVNDMSPEAMPEELCEYGKLTPMK